MTRWIRHWHVPFNDNLMMHIKTIDGCSSGEAWHAAAAAAATYKKPCDKADFRAFVSKRFHPDFSKIKKGAFANLVRTGMNRDGNLWLVLRVLGFHLSDMWPLR